MTSLRSVSKAITILALLVTVSACGEKSSPPLTTTTQKINYAQQYLDTVAPANDALKKFQADVSALPSNATAAQVADLTEPLADVFDEVDQKLLRLNWPKSVEGDIKELVKADAVVIADLRQVRSQTSYSVTNFMNQLSADLGQVSGTISVVRAELGLPPAENG